MLNVIKIIMKLGGSCFDFCNIALLYLCPAGNTRPHGMPVSIKRHFAFIPLGELHCLWSGSNPTHLSFNNIKDLRKFIDAVLSNKAPYFSDPFITIGRKVAPRGAKVHRAHFEADKRLCPKSNSFLFEQCRSRRLDANANYRNSNHHAKQRENQQS